MCVCVCVCVRVCVYLPQSFYHKVIFKQITGDLNLVGWLVC